LKLSYMWVDPNLPKEREITGIREDIDSVLEKLYSLGFNCVEVMVGNPFKFDPINLEERLKEYEMCVSQLCTGEYWGSYNLCLNHPESEIRKEAIKWGTKTIELAKYLNCTVNIGRFRGKIWFDGRQKSIERMVDSLILLDEIAKQHEVQVLLEPLKPNVCDTLNNIQEIVELLYRLKTSNLSIMLDTDHTNFVEERDYIYDLKIPVVHLADSGHTHLGNGKIPFKKYFSVLKQANFDGTLSVETFCSELECIEEAYKFLLEYLLQENGGEWTWKNWKS